MSGGNHGTGAGDPLNSIEMGKPPERLPSHHGTDGNFASHGQKGDSVLHVNEGETSDLIPRSLNHKYVPLD